MASSPEPRHLKPPGHLWMRSGDLPELASDDLVAPTAGPPRSHSNPPLTRGEWWFWFLLAEVMLIIAMILLSYIWQWWRHGERVEGVIVEIEETSASDTRWATIQDPDTELDVTFALNPALAPWDSRGWGFVPEIGDTATAVVSRSDPSKVASPGELQLYVALWALLPLLTLLLPAWSALVFGWRALHRRPVAQRAPGQSALAPMFHIGDAARSSRNNNERGVR